MLQLWIMHWFLVTLPNSSCVLPSKSIQVHRVSTFPLTKSCSIYINKDLFLYPDKGNTPSICERCGLLQYLCLCFCVAVILKCRLLLDKRRKLWSIISIIYWCCWHRCAWHIATKNERQWMPWDVCNLKSGQRRYQVQLDLWKEGYMKTNNKSKEE